MNAMNTVVVTADSNGNVIGVSENNPDYGYVRVISTATQINSDGWLRTVKRSALIKGLVSDLTTAGFNSGDTLPGRIVVRESLEPFNPNNPDRDLKIAGDSGIVCRVDDQPIYRQSFYTSNPNAEDELIMHTNGDEIRQVQSANRTLSKLVVRSSDSKPAKNVFKTLEELAAL